MIWFGRFLSRLLAAMLLVATGTATAVPVVDPIGDYLSSYIGPRTSDLDIAGADVALVDGRILRFSVQLSGFFGESQGIYAWILDRGAGTELLALQTPSIGAGLYYDAIVSFKVFGLTTGPITLFGSVNLFGLGGPSTRFTLTPFFLDQSIVFDLPVSLFPSQGLSLSEYRWNMFTEAPPGGTPYVADFAADDRMLRVAAVDQRCTDR